MKKIVLTTCIILISFATNAQIWGSKKIKGNGNIITKSRKIAPFKAIAVGGNFEVIIDKAQTETAQITADENVIPFIITKVKGNTLEIKFQKNVHVRTSNQVQIKVPLSQIEKISLGGSGKVTSTNLLKTQHLSINIGGSGTVDLEVEADKITTAIGGSGSIYLSGKTKKITSSLAGSGSVKAFGLVADEAKASIAGSGNVSVTVKNKIKTSIVGSGNFYYKGNPKHIKSTSLGSGDIIDKN